jgi:hypothetical protein
MNRDYLSLLIPLALLGGFIGLGMYLHRKFPPKPYVPPTFENEDERLFWEKCVAEFASNMGRGHEYGHWEGEGENRNYIPANRPAMRDAYLYADEMLYARRRRMKSNGASIVQEEKPE